MNVLSKLTSWLGSSSTTRRRVSIKPCAASSPTLRCESLEHRITPTTAPTNNSSVLQESIREIAVLRGDAPNQLSSNSEVLAITSSSQPLRDLDNLASSLVSSIDLARSSIIYTAGNVSLLQIGIQPNADADQTILSLARTGLYTQISPNFIYGGSGTADLREAIPNDPRFGEQYHHRIINTPTAWDRSIGTANVIVAVLDDGADITHSELQNTVWTNFADTPGDGVDNDGNGFTDDRHGWDFVNNRNVVTPDNPAIDNHGTRVAGLISAAINNGNGVAGVAAGARFMPLKVVNTGGVTTTNTLVRAVSYAVANGARIINTSINVDPFANDRAYKSVLTFAYDRSVLLVNSAGNMNMANPPRQNLTETLVIAATDRNDVKTPYSNYGSGIDLTAPGGVDGDGLLTTNNNESYVPAVGTSLSSPLVAGVAALVWSAFPAYTRDQVAATIIANADSILSQNPNFEDALGSGRLNAAKAVSGVPFVTKLGKLVGLPQEGEEAPSSIGSFTLRLTSPLDASTVTTSNFELRWAGKDNSFNTFDDQLLPLSINGGDPYRIGTNELAFEVNRPLERGLYRFTARSGGLRDPFRNPVDGDNDGRFGGDLVRSFGVVYQVSGQVYDDTRDDGVQDSTDPGLSDRTVFADTNLNGDLDVLTFPLNLPQPIEIPDASGMGASAITTVASVNTIAAGISVTVVVEHSRPSDLIITLVVADGTRLTLIRNRALPETPSGRNVFTFKDDIDEGTTELSESTLHRYRPVDRLSSLIGRDGNGNWRIEVIDTAASERGRVIGGSITMPSEPTAQTDANGFFTLSGLPSGLVRLNVLESPAWIRSAASGFVTIDSNSKQLVALGLTRANGAIGRVIRTDTNSGYGDVTVFVDLDQNGIASSGDMFTTTDSAGHFAFADLPLGSHTLSYILPGGFEPDGAQARAISLTSELPVSRGNDFRVKRLTTPVVTTVEPIGPTIRNTPVSKIVLELSEPLPQFRRDDFRLFLEDTRLSVDQLTFVGTNRDYVLLGLEDVTKADGNYRIEIEPPAPDDEPDRKPVPIRLAFRVDTTAPTAFLDSTLLPSGDLESRVQFSEPIAGLSPNSFVLVRDGQVLTVDNANVNLNADRRTATYRVPAQNLSTPGTYEVQLMANQTPIRDDASNTLTKSTTSTFTITPPPPPTLPPSNLVIGTDRGVTSQVIVMDARTGSRLQLLTPFGPDFTGGVRAAVGDLTGDGVDEIVAGAGPGGGPRVVVFNGATGEILIDEFAFEESFTGGVFVTLGDVNNDARPDIILSPDQGGGPRVRVLNGRTRETIADFMAIDDANFRGGVRTAVGDLNNDGVNDLTVSAGFGGGPRIALYDGKSIPSNQPVKFVNDFFAFEDTLRNGAYLAIGDVDGDRFGDVILAAGPGGAARVTILSGTELLQNRFIPIADFFAGSSLSRNGVRVAAKQADTDDFADVIVGDGSVVRTYASRDLRAGIMTPTREQIVFDDSVNGVFVG